MVTRYIIELDDEQIDTVHRLLAIKHETDEVAGPGLNAIIRQALNALVWKFNKEHSVQLKLRRTTPQARDRAANALAMDEVVEVPRVDHTES